MTNPIHVLYHQNCLDGFGACFSAWLAIGQLSRLQGVGDVTYTACSYADGTATLEAVPDGSVVYVLDFSFKREALIAANKRLSRLLVLDHHATAEQDLAGLDFCVFDMTKSGAMLAWEFFHAGPAPRLIECVQDRDLWAFKLPETHAVHMGLLSQPFDFEVWEKLLVPGNFDQLVADGKSMLRLQAQQVQKICEKASLVELEPGVKIPVCNTSVYFSEVPHRLLELYPEAAYAAYWYSYHNSSGELVSQWGLRGRPGGTDVSQVARLFGGGGHKPAAGFERKGGFGF